MIFRGRRWLDHHQNRALLMRDSRRSVCQISNIAALIIYILAGGAEQVKATAVTRLKEQVRCLRDCAKHLSDLATDLPPDTETITLIARNLKVTADYAANLLALHAAK